MLDVINLIDVDSKTVKKDSRLSSNQIKNDIVIIKGEDVNHISRVLRMKPRDEITICNFEEGTNYLVSIQNIQKEIIE